MGLKWFRPHDACDIDGGHIAGACWCGMVCFFISMLYAVFTVREACTVCGEDDAQWGTCEMPVHSPSPKAKSRKKRSDPKWLEAPPHILMNVWDIEEAVALGPSV